LHTPHSRLATVDAIALVLAISRVPTTWGGLFLVALAIQADSTNEELLNQHSFQYCLQGIPFTELNRNMLSEKMMDSFLFFSSLDDTQTLPAHQKVKSQPSPRSPETLLVTPRSLEQTLSAPAKSIDNISPPASHLLHNTLPLFHQNGP